jgi:hypothetical protein
VTSKFCTPDGVKADVTLGNVAVHLTTIGAAVVKTQVSVNTNGVPFTYSVAVQPCTVAAGEVFG